MAKTYDQRALDNPVNEGFEATMQRLYGWRCFFCKERTKEEACPKCGRERKEAE